MRDHDADGLDQQRKVAQVPVLVEGHRAPEGTGQDHPGHIEQNRQDVDEGAHGVLSLQVVDLVVGGGGGGVDGGGGVNGGGGGVGGGRRWQRHACWWRPSLVSPW